MRFDPRQPGVREFFPINRTCVRFPAQESNSHHAGGPDEDRISQPDLEQGSAGRIPSQRDETQQARKSQTTEEQEPRYYYEPQPKDVSLDLIAIAMPIARSRSSRSSRRSRPNHA